MPTRSRAERFLIDGIDAAASTRACRLSAPEHTRSNGTRGGEEAHGPSELLAHGGRDVRARSARLRRSATRGCRAVLLHPAHASGGELLHGAVGRPLRSRHVLRGRAGRMPALPDRRDRARGADPDRHDGRACARGSGDRLDGLRDPEWLHDAHLESRGPRRSPGGAPGDPAEAESERRSRRSQQSVLLGTCLGPRCREEPEALGRRRSGRCPVPERLALRRRPSTPAG
jgi:hypothetical protein